MLCKPMCSPFLFYQVKSSFTHSELLISILVMPVKTISKLAIGFKALSDSKNSITSEQIEYYVKYLRTLKPGKVTVVTLKEDPLLPTLKNVCDEVIELDRENYTYSGTAKTLYQACKDYNLLFVSIGVEIQNWQLHHGLQILSNHNLYTIGWRILSQENDGSYLGKLSYHTCMLLKRGFYEIFEQAGGFPEYVENGILGNLSFKINNEVKNFRVGGQEELALQLRIYKKFKGKKTKMFGHIKHYGVDFPVKLGMGVSYDEKIIRKVLVADIYRMTEEVDPEDFMEAWTIL